MLSVIERPCKGGGRGGESKKAVSPLRRGGGGFRVLHKEEKKRGVLLFNLPELEEGGKCLLGRKREKKGKKGKRGEYLSYLPQEKRKISLLFRGKKRGGKREKKGQS